MIIVFYVMIIDNGSSTDKKQKKHAETNFAESLKKDTENLPKSIRMDSIVKRLRSGYYDKTPQKCIGLIFRDENNYEVRFFVCLLFSLSRFRFETHVS